MLEKFINNILKKPTPAQPVQTGAQRPKPEYKRFNDAILVVTQDNKHGRLLINACNERAVKLIGYSEAEILSLDFRELLPPEIRETVDDYLDFNEKGRGIDDVLQKVTNFRLLGSRGRHVPVKLRVLRGVSDSGHISFRVIMNDWSLVSTLQEARKEYSILADKEALVRDMQQVIKHGTEYGYASSFAVISFSDGNTYLKRAQKMIESTKRDSDIIGLLNDNTLIYIMPDTPTSNVITPLMRFKNGLPADLKSKLVARYALIEENTPPSTQIANCLEGRTGKALN